MSLFGRKLPHVRNVIAGVIYDTQKAEHLASQDASAYLFKQLVPSMRSGEHQHLYRTNAGNWFLVLQQEYTAKIWVEPLTLDAAFTWLNDFQEVQLLERFFSDRLTDG